MSPPAKLISPAVGSISRSTQRPIVDLPEPDSPAIPSTSPGRTANDTPSTARTWPRTRGMMPPRMVVPLAQVAHLEQRRRAFMATASPSSRQRRQRTA